MGFGTGELIVLGILAFVIFSYFSKSQRESLKKKSIDFIKEFKSAEFEARDVIDEAESEIKKVHKSKIDKEDKINSSDNKVIIKDTDLDNKDKSDSDNIRT